MKKNRPYPMLLKPVGKNYLWGGKRLKTEYGKHFDIDPLAETWECSVHPDGQSIIRNGPFSERTLKAVLDEHPEYLGPKCDPNEGLPILIKLIDANKDLSVQVHPDDSYANEHEHDRGKTEMWYVLDALPGSQLVYGFEHPVNEMILKEAVDTGDLGKHLHKINVYKGDTFYIPAGTVHAIGAGIIIAEIQESSNVTYRVYDYDRIDADGKKRQLHFDKAIQVMNMDPIGKIARHSRIVKYFPGWSREVICRCQYFEAEHIKSKEKFVFSVRPESYQVILCLEGKGSIHDKNSKIINIDKGDCVFLPSGIGKITILGEFEMLKVRC